MEAVEEILNEESESERKSGGLRASDLLFPSGITSNLGERRVPPTSPRWVRRYCRCRVRPKVKGPLSQFLFLQLNLRRCGCVVEDSRSAQEREKGLDARRKTGRERGTDVTGGKVRKKRGRFAVVVVVLRVLWGSLEFRDGRTSDSKTRLSRECCEGRVVSKRIDRRGGG